MYTAIVLTDSSRDQLLEKMINFLPSNWEIVCHHHTINLGGVSEKHKHLLGKKSTLIVKEIGFSDKAVAVSAFCDEIKSENKIPHITLAINPTTGGKPKDSNEIKDWFSLKGFVDMLTVEGELKEIGHE